MNTFIFALALMNSVASPLPSPTSPFGLRGASTAAVTPTKATEPLKVTVIATAYTPRPEETDSTPWLTAAGTKTREGVIAANWLPFGTKVRIDGEVYTVEDRMHSRYTGASPARIDIVFLSLDKARKFGKQKMEIEILGSDTNSLGIVS
jgi:3D (Asp-Asp-Asp) domain-containing protein